MTPKEKASDLIDKYCELLKFDYPINRSMKLCAIRCAIICVEQIIDSFSEFTTAADVIETGADGELEIISVDSHSPVEYWKEILECLKQS